MPGWNIKLRPPREEIVRVKKIINQKPDFMVVQLSNGQQQKLCDANLPSWRQVEEGDRIRLVIHESVVGAIHVPEPFEKKVQEFLYGLQKEVSGLFFMWFCKHCKTMGYVTYEDGGSPVSIAQRIDANHKKEIKPGCDCDRTKLMIYDHRGQPHPNSASIVSAMK